MWFVVIGLAVLLLKYFGVPPVGDLNWSDHWWWLLSPWALAMVWWSWADSSGWTRKKAMQKADAVKQARRERQLRSLGLGQGKKRP